MKFRWYRYTFEDGAVVICRGFSPQELTVMVDKHGKLISMIYEGEY